jgi:hypothetical protein
MRSASYVFDASFVAGIDVMILLQPNSDSEDEAPKPKKKPAAAPPKKKKVVSDSDSDRYAVMYCQPVL